MPPKPKFTRDEIVQAALTIVSEKGIEALTAKELGDALGASARPIFTVFATMKEVQDAVREAAMRRFESYAEQKLPGMPLFCPKCRRTFLISMRGQKTEYLCQPDAKTQS